MENVSIKGLGIAIVITLVFDMIIGAIGFTIFAGEMTEEAMLAMAKQTSFLLYALFAGILSTILGGYISARYGVLAPYKNSAIFGVVGVLFSLLLATFDPIWFDVVGFLTVIPAAMFGGYLVAKKNE